MSAKILIADDEPNQLELIRYNLVQAGYEVIEANNGASALRLADERAPNLVILDWMMPDLSGIEVCRELRARKETREIPIIMLSARGQDVDRATGLDSGADDYVAKPFSPRELVARVKALLRRTSPSLGESIIEYHGLTLNPITMQAHRDGALLKLSAREFRLLSILIERPERVFSRRQLLDMVWGHGIYVEERTVDVHMSRLRKAINRNATQPDLVRTVRGAGYALAPPAERDKPR